MRSNYYNTLFVNFYPAIYGIILIFIINNLFNNFINSLLRSTKLLTVLRFFEFLEVVINNLHLVFIMVLLMFIEALVIIVNAKILVLVEAFLLLVYCWSIEIVILYLVLSYLCLKIIQSFVPKQEIPRTSRNILVDQDMLTKSHTVSTTITSRHINNLMLIIIGLCIGIHIIYSYYLMVNLLSMIIYTVFAIAVITKRLKHPEARYQIIDALLVVIPPFGVISALYRILFIE